MILYLCRHAHAVDPGEGIPDESRWLTGEGRREAAEVGAALARQGEAPEVILTSPLVRAVQTASELAHTLHFESAIAVLSALAPEGRLSRVLDALAEWPDRTSIALVGHEPQMSEWTAALLARPTLGRSFQKGAVVRINFDGHPEPGKGRGVFYLSPQHPRPQPL